MKNTLCSALLISSSLCLISFSAHALNNGMAPLPQAQHGLYVSAADQPDLTVGAKSFIQSMAQRGIDFLGNDKLTAAQRKEQFRQLLRSSYDLRTIGRFALGPYWRTATKAQQEEYQALFEKLVVNVYASRFSEYKGQQLVVNGARMEENHDVIVSSTVVPSKGGDKIDVDWRVRQKNGQYKVIDVIVAGVSQALTQRSDFASVIQQGGGDINVLLQHLRAG